MIFYSVSPRREGGRLHGGASEVVKGTFPVGDLSAN